MALATLSNPAVENLREAVGRWFFCVCIAADAVSWTGGHLFQICDGVALGLDEIAKSQ